MIRLSGAYTEEEVVMMLRESGYIVLAPSDTSPVAELVRAAVAFEDDGGQFTRPSRCGYGEDETVEARVLASAVFRVSEDPAVKAWVERGRK